MERFVQKWVLVSFLEPVEVGLSFHSSEWLLHVTIMQLFQLRDAPAILMDEITNIAQSLEPTQETVGEIAYFGPEENVEVNLVKMSQKLIRLHGMVLSVLKKHGAIFDTPQYIGKNYRAHITAQKHARKHKGEKVSIDSISLIDMFPGRDGHMRKVVWTKPLQD